MKKIFTPLLAGIATTAVILALGVIGGINSGTFKAAFLTSGQNINSGEIYSFTNYAAKPQEQNSIQLFSGNANRVDAVSFDLIFDPSKVTINENEIKAAGSVKTQNPMLVATAQGSEKITVFVAGLTPFSLMANEAFVDIPMTIKPTVTPGENIKFSFSNVSMAPAGGSLKSITVGDAVVTVTNGGLELLSAESTSSTGVTLTFSDFVIGTSVQTPASYSIINTNGQSAPVSAAVVNGKTVLLSFVSPLTPLVSYTVKASLNGDIAGNAVGKLASGAAQAIFTGYGISTTGSSITSASSPAENRISVGFSSLPQNANNPTIYKLYRNGDTTLSPVTILAADVSGNNVSLSTAQLNPGSRYTLIANNIGSSQNTATITAFLAPTATVTAISPNTLTKPLGALTASDSGSIVITGQNLPSGTVSLGSVSLQSVTATSSQVTVNVPFASFPQTGVFDLVLHGTKGDFLAGQVTITAAKAQMRVLSAESIASPSRIPNNGTTKSTLWAKVEAPQLDFIDKVSVDLRPISGSPIATMQRGDIVNGQAWYALEVTAPATAVTSETPKQLMITVRDKDGNSATGSVSLTITNSALQSQAPQILTAYATPNPTFPSTQNTVQVAAQVQDFDGIGTVTSIVADLGPLGLGPVAMAPITASGSSVNQTTATGSAQINQRWFTTSGFTLPSNIQEGNYSLAIIATDSTGMTGTGVAQMSISRNFRAPTIDQDQIKIAPRVEVPNDGKTTFAVSIYVTNPNTIDSVASVIADLSDLGGIPTEMKLIGSSKLISMTSSGTVSNNAQRSANSAVSAWFTLDGIAVPPSVIVGPRTMRFMVTDISGAHSEWIKKDVLVTRTDTMGNPPAVKSDQAYTTPSVVKNDGATKITLYTFVSDPENDIVSVQVNLGGVAKYTANGTMTTSNAENSCTGNTDRIVCMNSSIKEGSKGRWYVLPDVTVLPTTLPSSDPYRVTVTATDASGHTGEGFISINVGDGTLPRAKTGYPKITYATAINQSSVEVLLDNPIDPKRINANGTDFQIVRADAANSFVKVNRAYGNALGTVITLETELFEPSVKYTVIANQQTLGLKSAQFSDNRATFTGYQKSTVPPQLIKVKNLSNTLIELTFSNDLRPNSITADGSDFQIFTTGTPSEALKISTAELVDNQTVLLSTETQMPGEQYRIRVKNIESSASVPVIKSGLTKEFNGYSSLQKETKEIMLNADFNGDGKVDFTDFTIFSQAYGKMVNTASVSQTAKALSTGGSAAFPLTPTVNGTQPTTSSISQ